jgi:hypothetical protein
MVGAQRHGKAQPFLTSGGRAVAYQSLGIGSSLDFHRTLAFARLKIAFLWRTAKLK